MCIPGIDPVTIGMIASAAGAGASGIAQHQALQRQDREVARGITQRAGLQRQAGERVNQQINEVAAANPEAERRTAQNDFMAALRNAKLADGSADIGGPAGASDRFGADVTAARAAAGTEGGKLAGTLARIDAPTFQRQREATGANNAAVDLSLIDRNASGLDFLTQMRAGRAGQVDPLLSGLGQGLSAFGPAYAGRELPTKPPKKVTRFLPGAPD